MQKPGQALDISVGPIVWYAWWSPNFKNLFTGNYPGSVKNLNLVTQSQASGGSWDNTGTFLLGPAVSVKFSEKWSLAAVFTTNVPYDQTGRSQFLNAGLSASVIKNEISIKTQKYDLDTTLSYSLSPYLKIFGGLKYQGYSYSGKGKVIQSSVIISIPYKYSGDSNGYGAGAGLGATLPLSDSLYLLGNVSAVYINSRVERLTDSRISKMNFFEYYNSVGPAGSLSLAYYIPSASVTISLGGKFQMLKFYCRKYTIDSRNYNSIFGLDAKLFNDKQTESLYKKIIDGSVDYFYGATLSVTYNFQI